MVRDTLIFQLKLGQFVRLIFQIGVKLVLPARLIDDLKSHPHLSFKVSIDNVRSSIPDHLHMGLNSLYRNRTC